jgi:hypothetical protein
VHMILFEQQLFLDRFIAIFLSNNTTEKNGTQIDICNEKVERNNMVSICRVDAY